MKKKKSIRYQEIIIYRIPRKTGTTGSHKTEFMLLQYKGRVTGYNENKNVAACKFLRHRRDTMKVEMGKTGREASALFKFLVKSAFNRYKNVQTTGITRTLTEMNILEHTKKCLILWHFHKDRYIYTNCLQF